MAPLMTLPLAACGELPTTAADAVAVVAVPPAPRLALQGDELSAVRMAAADARLRLLPAIAYGDSEGGLAAALASAEDALEAGDARRLSAALESLRAAVGRLSAEGDPAVTADLDALVLTLDNLDLAVPTSLRAAAGDGDQRSSTH
jgi:hypothetical protein